MMRAKKQQLEQYLRKIEENHILGTNKLAEVKREINSAQVEYVRNLLLRMKSWKN
jgi:hypothetical protein